MDVLIFWLTFGFIIFIVFSLTACRYGYTVNTRNQARRAVVVQTHPSSGVVTDNNTVIYTIPSNQQSCPHLTSQTGTTVLVHDTPPTYEQVMGLQQVTSTTTTTTLPVAPLSPTDTPLTQTLAATTTTTTTITAPK